MRPSNAPSRRGSSETIGRLWCNSGMRALDDFRLFEHLAATRHYGRTSAECHVSPSTLSRTITRLEVELGVRLFERDRRTVTLTPAGVRFHDFARRVLEAWSAFHAPSATHDRVTGTISIFCTVTASQSILPDLLARFRESHPDVTLTVETGYAAEALQKLEDGHVDVTVAALPPRAPRHLVTRAIATTSLVLVAPASRPYDLLGDPRAAWSSVPFVLPAAGLVRTLADRWFRSLRVRPTVAAEATGHEAVLSLVSLGCGVGVVPELVAAGSPLAARLEILHTSAPAPSFEIAVCTTPERLATPAVAAFWSTLPPPMSWGATPAADSTGDPAAGG